MEIAPVHVDVVHTGGSLGSADPYTLQVRMGSKHGIGAEVLPVEPYLHRRLLCGSDAAVGREARAHVG